MTSRTKLQIETRIRDCFPELEQFRASNDKGIGGGIDCFAKASVQGKPVVIAAKLTKKASGERLQGTLARLWLELQALQTTAPILLPIVIDESVGENVIGGLKDFALRCLRQSSFAVIGANQCLLKIPEMDISIERSTQESTGRSPYPKSKRSRIFTDVDRWLLKIFLLESLRTTIEEDGPPKSVWPPKDARALSYFAAVAYETARSFCESYAERGFLIRNPAPIRLTNVEALLQSWLEAERGWTQELAPARSVDGRKPDLRKMKSPQFRTAIGGFRAAGEHGMKHASNPSPTLVHVDVPPAIAMVEWDLVKCQEDQAQVLLQRPAHPISVFRAADVGHVRGYKVVDPWQAALDVVSMRKRGPEQAQFILRKLLAEWSK